MINSHQMTTVVLTVVLFLFDNLRKKRSVSLTSQVLHVLKILCDTLIEKLLHYMVSKIQFNSTFYDL